MPIDERGADPRDDVIGVVVAVQQQHVTQDAGAGLVAQVSAGEVPELLMLRPEPAARAGLDERGRAGQCAGASPQHFEVVIQLEDLAAPMNPSGVGGNGGAVDDHGDGLRSQLDVHASAGVTDRHRVEALAHTHP